MPKVSVIVPIYGVEKYIERCARSLFEQTIDDLEILFIDDCTLDNSMEILGSLIEEYQLRFAEKNYSVRTDRMPTNSGLAAVRRHGVHLATGDYIIHCDSDDWVDLNLYGDLYSSAMDNDCELSICDLQAHNGTDSLNPIIGCFTNNKKDFISSLLYQNTPWSLCNKLFKRELYNSFVEKYPTENMGEDMALTMQLMQGVSNFSYIKSAKYYYYSNLNSISKTSSVDAVINRFFQYLHNYQIVKDKYMDLGVIDEYKKEFIWLEYSVKAILNNPDSRCVELWKNTFPHVEYKVLIDKNVTAFRKKLAIKSIIKHLI